MFRVPRFLWGIAGWTGRGRLVWLCRFSASFLTGTKKKGHVNLLDSACWPQVEVSLRGFPRFSRSAVRRHAALFEKPVVLFLLGTITGGVLWVPCVVRRIAYRHGATSACQCTSSSSIPHLPHGTALFPRPMRPLRRTFLLCCCSTTYGDYLLAESWGGGRGAGGL